MAAKLPSMFKRPIKDKKFIKRYLRFIEQPSDREFLESSFELQGVNYVVRKDLDPQAIKRLTLLAKAIKSNRGSLKIIVLLALVIVVLGIGFFYAFLMNPLLEKGMEKGLELVFQARSDVEGLALDIPRLKFSIASITVANRDRPMRNLFQLGHTELRLNLQALLMGRFYIEEARADALLFGTEREVSGALPDLPAQEKPKREGRDVSLPPIVDLTNFDAQALLEREMEKLSIMSAYGEAEEAYAQGVQRWQGRAEEVQGRITELQGAVKPILSINIKNLNSIDKVKSTVDDLKGLIDKSQEVVGDAEGLVSAVQEDLERARALEKSARSAVDKDLALLKSYIDPSSGAALNVLEPVIRDVLSDSVEEYIEYGKRGLEMVKKLKSLGKEEDEQPKGKVNFKGRDVLYPSRTYPQFRLGLLASDFTIQGYRWVFELTEVSTDPDLIETPTSLSIEVAGHEKKVNFDVVADLRTQAEELFSARSTGSGFPVELKKELQKAGVGAFSGSAAFDAKFLGGRDTSIKGSAEVFIQQATLHDPSGTIAQALADAVAQAEQIEVGVAYDKPVKEKESFRISTNVLTLAEKALRDAATRYAKQAAEELEKAFRSYVSDKLEGSLVSKEELELLFSAVKGDKEAIDKLQKALDEKRKEAEDMVQNTIDEAKRQAEEAAQKLKAEAEKKAAEAAAKLKEEAEKKSAEAAAKLKEEAEKKAQETLKKTNLPKLDKPKLPF